MAETEDLVVYTEHVSCALLVKMLITDLGEMEDQLDKEQKQYKQ